MRSGVVRVGGKGPCARHCAGLGVRMVVVMAMVGSLASGDCLAGHHAADGGGSDDGGGPSEQWDPAGGTTGPVPAWGPCADWSVRLGPIEETEFEGRGNLGGAPCMGAVHGSRSFWSGLNKARTGAFAQARARDCHMHGGCETSVPTDEQQDGAVGLTVDSGARRALRIRFTPSEESAPVPVFIRAVFIRTKGTLEIEIDLEAPLEVHGCANAFGDARLQLDTNLPWPWLLGANPGNRGDRSKVLEINANQCTGGSGGATLGLNGSFSATGPAVGASVDIPLGPNSNRGRVFWRQKFLHQCRGCVVPPTEPGEWTYALNADCSAAVDLLEGVTADVRARAIIEDLEFRIDQGESSVGCPSCVPTPTDVAPGEVGGGA